MQPGSVLAFKMLSDKLYCIGHNFLLYLFEMEESFDIIAKAHPHSNEFWQYTLNFTTLQTGSYISSNRITKRFLNIQVSF